VSLLLTLSSTAAASLPVLVLNNPTEAPFTTVAGDGMLDVVVSEAFRRAGLRLKLVRLPAERGLISADSGLEDGDLSRIAGLEKIYHNLVRVPEKIFDMQFVAFTRTPRLQAADWRVLEPLSVGYIKGWKIFEQNLNPKTQVTTVDGPEQLMDMLGRSRIEVALYERWMGLAVARKQGLSAVRVAEPALAEREMFIYLHKRHAAYIPALANALRAIKQEGMYTRVCREKFSVIAPPANQCDVK
jgi:polar amino acid transport system substrate-binding protein